MIGFLSAASNLPFSVALGVMLLLAAVETLGVLIAGTGISHLLDGVSHGPDVDVHHGPDVDADTAKLEQK